MLLGHNQQNLVSFAFFGAEFRGNSAEAGATRRFLSLKIHFLPRKIKKKN